MVLRYVGVSIRDSSIKYKHDCFYCRYTELRTGPHAESRPDLPWLEPPLQEQEERELANLRLEFLDSKLVYGR